MLFIVDDKPDAVCARVPSRIDRDIPFRNCDRTCPQSNRNSDIVRKWLNSSSGQRGSECEATQCGAASQGLESRSDGRKRLLLPFASLFCKLLPACG